MKRTARQELDFLKECEAAAPSYVTIQDDGGGNPKCHDCGLPVPFPHTIFCFTPDGKRTLSHKGCIDEMWLENAKNMGVL